MKRLLVDLNVVLDVLLDREPHVAASAAVWAAIEEGRAEGMVPAHGFTTIFYLVTRHGGGRAEARRVVADLLAVFRVAGEDETVVRRAAALDLPDFEDAVVAAAAEAAACEAIVTRDPAGFADSPVPALDPPLALALLADEVHEPPPAYRRRHSR